MSEIFVIIAASLWGISGIFLNTLTAMGFGREDIIFSRALMTALFGIIMMIINRKKEKPVKLKDLWIFFGAGVVGFLGLNITYLRSIQLNGLSLSSVLLDTAPIFVMIFAVIFFRESFTKRKALALAAAFCGCLCVTGVIGGELTITPMGITLGLISGLCYSLYTIFGQIGIRKYDPITVTTFSFSMAALFSLPLIDFKHLIAVSSANPKGLFLLILCGIATSVLPYVLYTLALAKLDAGRAAIISCVEPVVATLAGVLLYDESLSVLSIIGICLVLSAVVILNIKLKKTRGDHQ